MIAATMVLVDDRRLSIHKLKIHSIFPLKDFSDHYLYILTKIGLSGKFNSRSKNSDGKKKLIRLGELETFTNVFSNEKN